MQMAQRKVHTHWILKKHLLLWCQTFENGFDYANLLNSVSRNYSALGLSDEVKLEKPKSKPHSMLWETDIYKKASLTVFCLVFTAHPVHKLLLLMFYFSTNRARNTTQAASHPCGINEPLNVHLQPISASPDEFIADIRETDTSCAHMRSCLTYGSR